MTNVCRLSSQSFKREELFQPGTRNATAPPVPDAMQLQTRDCRDIAALDLSPCCAPFSFSHILPESEAPGSAGEVYTTPAFNTLLAAHSYRLRCLVISALRPAFYACPPPAQLLFCCSLISSALSCTLLYALNLRLPSACSSRCSRLISALHSRCTAQLSMGLALHAQLEVAHYPLSSCASLIPHVV